MIRRFVHALFAASRALICNLALHQAIGLILFNDPGEIDMGGVDVLGGTSVRCHRCVTR